MTAAELRRAVSAEIAALDADVLLRHVLGMDRAELLTNPRREVSRNEEEQLRALVARRRRNEPVAYLTGEKEFWSLPLCVTPDVLIPRPETELLVERALAAIDAAGEVSRIVDIGTGSGAIILALAHELQKRGSTAELFATDVSPAALGVARANAARLGARVTFVETDLLQGVPERQPELLVSNPPYIADGDELPPDVSGYEPPLALRAGPDGLSLIRRLLIAASPRILAGSRLLFEIGAGQADAITSLLPAHFQVSIARDLRGLERVVELRAAA